MKIFSYTCKGIRETNEDYIKSEILSDSISLHIVADGMGGYEYGEVASQTATEAIFQFLAESNIQGEIPALIQQAVEFSNSQILTLRNQYHAKLGTTIAGVLIIDSTAYTFWLGDVQIQHFRDNKQLFISESHTLVNEMKKNGPVSTKEIERYKHIVTKSLSGTPSELHLPVVEIQLQQGDSICISSDGLYNSVNPATLMLNTEAEIITELETSSVNNQDNLSIIVLKY
ncbi:MAG: protein phosphatase 2C domain-containing protein [Bacteroidota bacterium]|nr:protein phosphatase 2C domain-containing protein [Bacteroidota bacterium]MDP4268538.1 protein phosphatase 2C domain-containing protein [Bacteroidota bacterium]